jgi:hypothetical protein
VAEAAAEAGIALSVGSEVKAAAMLSGAEHGLQTI